MIKIPTPDPNDWRYRVKNPSLDSDSKRTIVLEALVSATQSNTKGDLEISPSPENQLDQLYRFETLRVLETIYREIPSAFRIDESNYGKEPIPPDEMEDHFEFSGDRGNNRGVFLRPAPLPEDKPIKLTLFDGFDNWRRTYIQIKTTTFETLSEENQQKVLNAFVSILKIFELTAKPKITVQWNPGDNLQDFYDFKLSFDYLKNNGVIKEFKPFFSPSGPGGFYTMEINVKRFQEFSKPLAKYLQNKPTPENPNLKQTPIPEKAEDKPFKNLKWEGITIEFLNGHEVKITGAGIKTAVETGFKEMGFEDTRNRTPDKQWDLLNLLASKNGEISWDDPEADPQIKKTKQLLSKALRDYFAIADEPFESYKDQKSYRLKLKISS